jgi:hypothetical protein
VISVLEGQDFTADSQQYSAVSASCSNYTTKKTNALREPFCRECDGPITDDWAGSGKNHKPSCVSTQAIRKRIRNQSIHSNCRSLTGSLGTDYLITCASPTVQKEARTCNNDGTGHSARARIKSQCGSFRLAGQRRSVCFWRWNCRGNRGRMRPFYFLCQKPKYIAAPAWPTPPPANRPQVSILWTAIRICTPPPGASDADSLRAARAASAGSCDGDQLVILSTSSFLTLHSKLLCGA